MNIPSAVPARFKDFVATITTFSGVTKVSNPINVVVIISIATFCTSSVTMSIATKVVSKLATGSMLTYQFKVDFNRPSTCFDMLMFPITFTPDIGDIKLKQNMLGKPTEPIDSNYFNLDFET